MVARLERELNFGPFWAGPTIGTSLYSYAEWSTFPKNEVWIETADAFTLSGTVRNSEELAVR